MLVIPEARKTDSIQAENRLTRKHHGAILLGAYTFECVQTGCDNIASRVGKFGIGIDYALSIARSGTLCNTRKWPFIDLTWALREGADDPLLKLLLTPGKSRATW